MTLFKKFTDFCAGIAAFVGGLFLLQKYMVFTPLEDEEYRSWLYYDLKYSNESISESTLETIGDVVAPSKIDQFFNPKLINDFDYRPLCILVITLIMSVLIGRIFKKLPYVCFLVSLIPALEIAYIFSKELLYTQIGLFIILGALHVAGNLVECVIRDKEDGRHRLWVCAKISALFPAVFCLFCTKIAEKIPTEGIHDKIPIYKELAFKLTKPENMEIVTKIGWMFFIIFIISVLLYNVYFIDAILSVIPLVYTIHLLYSENLKFNPVLFTLLAAVCFMTHILLCVFENNLSHKEQLRLKETELKTENNQPTENAELSQE